MTYLFQQFLNILQLGSIYTLIALGYAIVYSILRMINFAHGDVFMLGAFICLFCVRDLGLSFIPALILVMIGCALIGALIERLAYRPLRDAPVVSALITALGLGLFFEHSVLVVSPYSQNMPRLIEDHVWRIFGLTVSSLQLIIIFCSSLLVIALNFLIRRTMLGLAMQAVSIDKNAALLMGIPVNRVIGAAFAIGAALGGAAAVFYCAAYPVVEPYMGVSIGWKAFISAVIGGIGSIWGAAVGSFLLATTEILVCAVLPSTYRDFIAFGLLLVVLMIRPCGILGRPQVQKV